MSTTKPLRALSIDNINQHIVKAKYAVRGEIPSRAEKYVETLKQKGSGKAAGLPFDQVIHANIGNPQQLDQKPLTFFRQVLSLVENPILLAHKEVLQNSLGYKSDAIARAEWLLQQVKSVGAYSQSQGATGIRQSVAKFIERRDGYPTDPESIFLSAGASSAVNTLLHIICSSPDVGVLVPIPQYPLYTASMAVLDARVVPYYLDESKGWSLDVNNIRESLAKAKAEGTKVRAIDVINPGNPTGASLPPEDIRAVLQLAQEERLVVIGDEVYQTNVFKGEFTSFKKGLRDLQKEAGSNGKYDAVELASLHSTSKGMIGECGHRGGYFEFVGFDEEVVAQMYKFVSVQLCPPITGQCVVEMMVNPPREGEPSYETYRKEYDAIFKGLRERAMALYAEFKQMEGVECDEPQGSMYLFPTIHLSEKACKKAEEEGKSPDGYYCLRMLDATGVCVVPGDGFGQKPGTLHFRTTFLAPGTEWVGRITKFHQDFMNEFR